MTADRAEAARAALPPDVAPGDVEVVGDGPLADRLRALLGRASPPDRPAATIDTTGDLAAIAEALRRLDSLGTLVLAGPAPANAALDLYSDLHVRGLTMVGLPPAGEADA